MKKKNIIIEFAKVTNTDIKDGAPEKEILKIAKQFNADEFGNL